MPEDVSLRSSSTRYGKGRTTAREVLGYVDAEPAVTRRASRPGLNEERLTTRTRRPAPREEAHMSYPDPDTSADPYRHRTTDGVTRRSAATKAQPTQTRRKTYIPEEKPLPNRRQRRLDLNHFHPMFWVGLTLFGLMVLYYLGSLAYDAWVLSLSDPAMYGPAHGSVVEIIDGNQVSYAHGINDHGHIEMIVIPQDSPQKARIYLGPQDVPTNIEVDLEIMDLNKDGHPDIIEHLEGNPSSLFFPRPELKSYDWINDGKGGYKLEP